eukprot:scaffold287_cov337-Pavlova_lutheri.AAC.54
MPLQPKWKEMLTLHGHMRKYNGNKVCEHPFVETVSGRRAHVLQNRHRRDVINSQESSVVDTSSLSCT